MIESKFFDSFKILKGSKNNGFNILLVIFKLSWYVKTKQNWITKIMQELQKCQWIYFSDILGYQSVSTRVYNFNSIRMLYCLFNFHENFCQFWNIRFRRMWTSSNRDQIRRGQKTCKISAEWILWSIGSSTVLQTGGHKTGIPQNS